ncbi:MAG: DUF3566 domain-containing protein [Microthrixaceae bacterium]
MTTTPSAEQRAAQDLPPPPLAKVVGEGALVPSQLPAPPTGQGMGRAQSPEGTEPAGPTSKRLLGYRRQRFEARKVRRLIRHIDPWSMLKLALLLSLSMWFIVMVASVIMWTVASNAGTVASIENFVNSSLSLQDWKLDGDFLFRQFGLVTLLLALGFTAATVVATLVFNLVSDIIGGVWISVIEEETARPVSESKRSGRVG